MGPHMTTTETSATGTSKGVLRKIPGLLLRSLRFLLLALAIAWGSLALYFSPIPATELRIALGVAFAAFGIWAVWISREPRMRWIFAALYVVLLVGWSFIEPSHDRDWRPDVAVMPRATFDGDRIRITGVRNFDYRSRDDFTVRYEEREVSLSNLVALDFFISYWMPGPVGHTFLSFIFEDAPPLNISIETRPEKHEGFDPLASLFKQYELIYVVGEERDIVGVRTNFRGEDVYMYRLRIPAANARKLLQVYLERINELADRPEFYHLLSNSCTINIVRYANLVGRQGDFDLRHYLNGWVDRYFYDTRLLDPEFSFAELRRRSRVNPAVPAAADVEEFAEHIRESVPGMQHRDTPTRAAPDTVSTLTAYRWQLESARTAAGEAIPALFPAAAGPLGLLVADGRLNVTGGCNHISAGYTWLEGARLQVGPGQSTMMACPPPLAEADAAIAGFLSGTLQVSVEASDGTPWLQLAAEDGRTLSFRGTPTAETRFGGPGTRAFLEVSPQPCAAPATAACLRVRERQFDENGLASGVPGEWRPLPEGIAGYVPTPGEQQVVRVKRFEQPGTPPTEHFVFDMVVESRTVQGALSNPPPNAR